MDVGLHDVEEVNLEGDSVEEEVAGKIRAGEGAVAGDDVAKE